MSSEHTLVIIQHIVRLTDAALLAGGGDFVARALTAAVWVQAGRRTGGKAVCVVTVSWALQSYGSEGDWHQLQGPEEVQGSKGCSNQGGFNQQNLSFILLVFIQH